jgi:hypothetical protein
MSRIDKISQNGNDGLHYDDLVPLPEMRERFNAPDNGKSGRHYELPEGCTELKHLIWYKNMNGQVAEAFRKLYRLGEGDRNDVVRDLNGVIAYCTQELERLDMYEQR